MSTMFQYLEISHPTEMIIWMWKNNMCNVLKRLNNN